jgi:hypothetical protein
VSSTFKSAILLLSILLAGCAPQTLLGEKNPAVNERIKSARITFSRPAEMAISYTFSRTYSISQEVAQQGAVRDVERIIKAVQDHVPLQLSNALQKKGVVAGPGVLVSLRPTAGWGTTNTTPRIQLEVTVQSGDRTKQPWIAKISDGSWERMPAEQTAQIFTDRILFELAKAGFVPQ